MQQLLFFLVYPLLWLLSWLPLRVLYLISDVICPVLHYVVRYRVRVVRRNLSQAFPHKTEAERRTIERRFYHHLCDYGLETLWLMHASKKAIKKHIHFDNIDLLLSTGRDGKNVIALFGHYCNWEWVCSIPLFMDDTMRVATLYKPLKSRFFDKMLLDFRSKFGTECVAKNRVMRAIVQFGREHTPFVLAFIADQTPSAGNIRYWTTFLNQDTPFLTGWESIAKKSNAIVVFLNMQKVRRGFYQCRVEQLSDAPQQVTEYALIEKYARKMEENILLDPAHWLWTHKRWKHQR
jgi:KDO2-lipid IV(A) lauroyltransferase